MSTGNGRSGAVEADDKGAADDICASPGRGAYPRWGSGTRSQFELFGPGFHRVRSGRQLASSGSSRSKDGWTAGSGSPGGKRLRVSSRGTGRTTVIRPVGVAGQSWRRKARSGATSSSIAPTTLPSVRSAPQATPHDEQASTSMLAAPSSRHPGCAPSAAWSPGTRQWSIALAESSVHSGKIFASAITFRSTSITSKSSGCAVHGGCRSSPAPGPALTSCTRLLRRRRRCADRRSSHPVPGPAGPSPPRGSQRATIKPSRVIKPQHT